MTYSTILNLMLQSNSRTQTSLQKQIEKSADLVSDGRYLISVFASPTNWEVHTPVEALIVTSTLGPIENRSPDWEFYGNGVIRCYKGSALKLSRTFQWNILRRTGAKPYKRRGLVPSDLLKDGTLPVSDKVFTRDVANNVWHLKEEDLQKRLIERFSRLLSWQDEDFILITGTKTVKIQDRKNLALIDDLVGVPTRVAYFWGDEESLF